MIVLNGKLDRILRTNEFTIVSFTIQNYQAKYLDELTDELYSIEIKKPKSRKTLAQNNYAWQLMTEIARELAIYPSPEEVYMQVVKMAKIKTVFLESLNDEKVIDGLKKTFRIVDVKQERLSVKGKETVMLECYWGMSNFDKEEMQRFIDVLLNYASEVGIDVSGYER